MGTKFRLIILCGLLAAFTACDIFSDKALTTEPFSPKGTISGALIDVATQQPIIGAKVSLSYPLDEDSDSSVTDTKGRFLFEKVPVVMEGRTLSEDDDGLLTNYPYGIHIDMSGISGYRANYYMQVVNLVFESTGGDGPAVDLISNLILPLGKRNVTVTGKVLDPVTKEPLQNATIELYMGDTFGELEFVSEVKLDEATTGNNGVFEFYEVEQGQEVYFKVSKSDDPQKEVLFTSGDYTLPASAEPFSFNIGSLQPFSSDNSAEFYVTSVSPENNSDLTFDQVEFVINFNQPVKETSYTRTTLGYGNGTIIDDVLLTEIGSKAKRADGSYEVNVDFNEDRTQLTITSAENLLDGMKYQLDIQNVFQTLTDTLDKNLSFGFDYPFQSINDAGVINFSTGENNAIPSTPSLTALDIDSLDYNGGNIEFQSTINESQTPIAHYEFFIAEEGEPFEFVGTVDKKDNNFFGTLRFNYNPGALYETGYNGQPVAAALKEVKIRAVSHNLQRSAYSNTVIIEDNEDPDIDFINTTTNSVTIIFSEPLDYATASDRTNYSVETPNGFGGFNTVSGAVLRVEDFNNTAGGCQLTVVFDANVYQVTPGDQVKVETDVTDLAGNRMDDNRRTF